MPNSGRLKQRHREGASEVEWTRGEDSDQSHAVTHVRPQLRERRQQTKCGGDRHP